MLHHGCRFIYKEREVRGDMFPSTCFPSLITDWLPGFAQWMKQQFEKCFHDTVDDVDEGGNQSSSLDGNEKMSESDHLG